MMAGAHPLLLGLALAALLALLALAGLLAWGAAKTRAAVRVAEQALPAAGRIVPVAHARLHVVEQGTARPGVPPILMVHGLAGQLHHFTYALLPALAAQTRVVAVDRPGSGYSTRDAEGATTLQQQADALAALIDRLQLGRPLVVGHSLGGALALTLALRHPQRVAGLALLAPLTHKPDAVPPAFRGLNVRFHWLRWLIGHTLAAPAAAAQRDAILGAVFGPEPVPADYDLRAGGLLGLRPSHYIATSEDLRALEHSLPQLQALYPQLAAAAAPPIAILYGRGDRILDPQRNGSAFVAAVPHARLQWVEGAGHMLPLTQPARCIAFIREALASAA